MKKILTLLAFFSCLNFNAQAPQFINYQAILRDAAGVPIAAGTTVNLNVKIFNDGTASSLAYEENHNNITVPSGNVINIKIGKGIGVPPNNSFSAIMWNQGTVEYIISLNGTPLGTRDRFASVPFALNAGGASVNYSPSANVSITGNVLDLTDKLSNTVTVGSNLNPNSKVPMFSADKKGRIVYAGEYAANLGGDIAGRLDSQYVMKLKGVPLSNVLPTTGQVLQYNGTSWAPNLLSGSGPWSYSTGVIYPSNSTLGDKVAIGSSVASSMLDVKNSGLSPFTSGPVVSIINSNPGLNPGNGMVNISHQNGAGPALFVQNMNSGATSEGLIVSMTNNANANDGLRVSHPGSGRAGNFINSNQTATIEVLGATGNGNAPVVRASNLSSSNSSVAIGVHGKTQNSHPNAAGVWGENTGGGSGVIGTTSANVAAVVGVNLSGANQANGNGVYGLSNSSSTVSAGVFGEHKFGGSGVFGTNTYSNLVAGGVSGVYGTVFNTSNINSGVFGEVGGSAIGVKGINKGSGVSIAGTKPVGTTGGSAGRFEILDGSNISPALYAFTQGQGAAVHAAASTAATSTLALLLEEGHIKSIGPAAFASSVAVQSGFSALTASCSSCTDVKGKVIISVNSTTVASALGLFRVQVSFAKQYSSNPIVVVTPTQNTGELTCFVSAVNQGFFQVTFINNTPVGLSGLPTNFSFNYIVIE